MKNREVSIGVCGAIVGILIGAGSVAYGQELTSSLGGDFLTSTLVGYRNNFLDEAFQKRSLRSVDHPREEEPEKLHQAAPELTGDEREACETKVRIAEELRDIVVPLIPSRPIDQLVRHSINQAFDSYVADCGSVRDEVIESLEPVVEEVEEVDVEPVLEPISDDHCDGFTGVRMTRCKSTAKEGIRYQGGFFQRNDLNPNRR